MESILKETGTCFLTGLGVMTLVSPVHFGVFAVYRSG